MSRPADTPEPPYYAVIFTSTLANDEGYGEMADRMEELARRQPGFLGFENAREDGLGVTVSYWDTLDSIAAWKRHAEHLKAQGLGRSRWYEHYQLRVARVERAQEFRRRST